MILFEDSEFTVYQVGDWQLTETKYGEAYWEWYPA